MKTTKLVAIALLVSIFISCSKDDDTTEVLAPEQNPLAGYLQASGFNQVTTNVVNGEDFEFGYSFKPLVNGKMTAIVVKIPDARNGLRITVWDKVAGTVLRTETIDIATANVEVTKSVTPLNLESNKEYFLTFNSNDWYDRSKTDNTPATYPITVGDIQITSYSYFLGATQTMPNTPQTEYYAGDCSFKFQK